MKKLSFAALALVLAVSCGRYHVTNEIKNGAALTKLKNMGIIIRATHNSPISIAKLNKSLSQWLEPYVKAGSLVIIEKTSGNINRAKSESDRFLQFSKDNDFQYTQSIGIITQYLNKNKEELDKIRSENNLDGLIIYEIDMSVSLELQMSDFSSIVMITNNDNQILYMDRQFNDYSINEIDRDLLKEDILDQISNRFLDVMLDLKLIREKKA